MPYVHLHMPTDVPRMPAQDDALAQLSAQSADRAATYPTGAYTVELELECPADTVPGAKEKVTRHGDRAVTVVGPLNITTNRPMSHRELGRQVVADVLVALFRWDFDGRPCTILRFGAVPGHLARLSDLTAANDDRPAA
ncbi:hypothetical protein ADK76_28945 [Streptomyces griseoflavus]|uniref:hypothetical protein n=1 Tax=Streptomyces rimosus TaxID=1927 RepID=UPI0004C834AB|nr:hypothetical protein [Streptomyces rimosus]KOG53143.1 hypothetical protein ADK76_28945 [Streptomyces griseoflavus]